jgi:hypothetical protein
MLLHGVQRAQLVRPHTHGDLQELPVLARNLKKHAAANLGEGVPPAGDGEEEDE